MQNAQLYRRQSELRVATETMEAVKTQFMTRASRELRAALATILENAAQPPEAANLARIHSSAADLLKLTDDLLDLAQTDIGSPAQCLLDVTFMLEEVWGEFLSDKVGLQTQDPQLWGAGNLPRLPLVFADRVQLHRGFGALFDHMRRLGALGTSAGGAALTAAAEAAVELPFLHVWLSVAAVPSTADEGQARSSWGVELSLTRARRLFALLGGSLAVETAPHGLTFHVRLPLPTMADVPCTAECQATDRVLVISSRGRIDLPDRSAHDELLLQDPTQLDELLWRTPPGALLWDAQYAAAADWELLLAVRAREQLQRLPFLLYVPPVEVTEPEAALVRGQSLAATIAACCPTTASKSILLLAVDHVMSRSYRALIARCLPGVPVVEAACAADAGSLSGQMAPALIIADLHPDPGGRLSFIEQLRGGEQAQHCPVLLLTDHPLDAALVSRMTPLAPILYAGRFIFTPDELLALLARTFAAQESLPPRTSEVVKQAILFVQQHFNRPLNRSDIAEAVAVSENYLSQLFRQEMGISLWDYLNRQRIHLAKGLLQSTPHTVTEVAAAVGIYDPAYFSRIFHKQTGLSPSAYRVAAQRAGQGN
jgi:AraC-like DNA-binding protein